jgi:hypothetical protein
LRPALASKIGEQASGVLSIVTADPYPPRSPSFRSLELVPVFATADRGLMALAKSILTYRPGRRP